MEFRGSACYSPRRASKQSLEAGKQASANSIDESTLRNNNIDEDIDDEWLLVSENQEHESYEDDQQSSRISTYFSYLNNLTAALPEISSPLGYAAVWAALNGTTANPATFFSPGLLASRVTPCTRWSF